MKDWLILHSSEIIGILGALLGTVFGWVLSKCDFGKLHIYVSSWEDEFYRMNSYGQMIPSSDIADVKSYRYTLSLELYNSSSTARIMRNIEVLYSNGTDVRKRSAPKDKSTKRVSNAITSYEPVRPINIPPKTVLRVDLLDSYLGDGLKFLWATDKVLLSYKNKCNRTKTILVKRGLYKDYFLKHRSQEDNPNG